LFTILFPHESGSHDARKPNLSQRQKKEMSSCWECFRCHSIEEISCVFTIIRLTV
jgi:hypothetical protein